MKFNFLKIFLQHCNKLWWSYILIFIVSLMISIKLDTIINNLTKDEANIFLYQVCLLLLVVILFGSFFVIVVNILTFIYRFIVRSDEMLRILLKLPNKQILVVIFISVPAMVSYKNNNDVSITLDLFLLACMILITIYLLFFLLVIIFNFIKKTSLVYIVTYRDKGIVGVLQLTILSFWKFCCITIETFIQMLNAINKAAVSLAKRSDYNNATPGERAIIDAQNRNAEALEALQKQMKK